MVRNNGETGETGSLAARVGVEAEGHESPPLGKRKSDGGPGRLADCPPSFVSVRRGGRAAVETGSASTNTLSITSKHARRQWLTSTNSPMGGLATLAHLPWAVHLTSHLKLAIYSQTGAMYCLNYIDAAYFPSLLQKTF